MAVPNEDTFTLQDVKSEIENNGGAATTSLVAAFANAVSNGFDPLYEGSKNQLLNFRNYNHNIVLVEITGHNTYGDDEIRLFLSSTTTEDFTLQGSYDEVTWSNRVFYSGTPFTTTFFDISINPGTNVYYFRIVMDSGAIGPTYTWNYPFQ